jgi:uncharacterized protein YjbJ (UPF0337 family)
MKASTKDRAQGKVRKVKGAIKETVGAAVGNRDLEFEGKVEKEVGKAQGAIGRIEKAAGK